MAWEDDIKTEYMGPAAKQQGSVRDTVVFSLDVNAQQPHGPVPSSCLLIRERTNERLQVALPSIVGRGAMAATKVRGNLAISRSHVRIKAEGDKVVIIDLGSVNGTKVRGARIPSNMAVEVHDGDEICLASERFCLRINR